MAQDRLVLDAAAGNLVRLAWSFPCEPGDPCDQRHSPASSAVGPGHTVGLQNTHSPVHAEARRLD